MLVAQSAPAIPDGAPWWVVIVVAAIAALPSLATLLIGLRTKSDTQAINRAVNHQPEDSPRLIDWAKGTNIAAAEILEKMHFAAMKVEEVATKAEEARVLAAEAVLRNEDTLAVAHDARDFAKKAARESGHALELAMVQGEQLHDLVASQQIVGAEDARGRRGDIERRREILARIRDERAEDGAET